MDDKELYGVFSKEKIDELKIKIDNILEEKNMSEDETFSVMKKVHEFVCVHKISNEFREKMRFDELIEKHKSLFDKISSYGRD
ncbi:MAG: hypothetical protein EVA26_02745 [Burkholderiaceae bacterium]|nr:MAG: hypothetical protein EVA26_02745 [Burkholderiaceae bacterium]|tara:strand:- start:3 stop:251 length:249 start_codon:yes stop_codon:yes gene_type:complete